MACPFLDCIVVSARTLRKMWRKRESKKEEKKGKDDKMGSKENGVGSGVEVQAEDNSRFLFLCHPVHSLSSSENYS